MPYPMEKMIETPFKTTLDQTETTIIVDSKNPIPRNSATEVCKPATPNRLKVPKAFKYPERYTSPTDLMMSPVSKGLLARNRKASRLLPPSINQPNLQSLKPQEAGLFGI